jgi:penicillin amidase/acyl-homoserine-lactone acylase
MKLVLILAISGLTLAGCAEKFNTSDDLSLGEKYDVVIERDYLGVPHVIGDRDIDAAFGFAYAQSEDNWEIIQESIPFYRGTNAKINGKDAAAVDFLVKWLGIWETIDADYESQLKPETRAWIDAFVDGINYYATLHPEQTINRFSLSRARTLSQVTCYAICCSMVLMHRLWNYLNLNGSDL